MKVEQRVEILEGQVSELIAKLAQVEETLKKTADRRGPKSEREMTDDDARRIMGGDLESKSHKDAAETLGLSYAQVYSARKGFTFKHIAKEVLEAKKKAMESTEPKS